MIEWIILLAAIPVGYLIAYLAKDELIQGRKWFRILIIAGFLAGAWLYITGNQEVFAFCLRLLDVQDCILHQQSWHND